MPIEYRMIGECSKCGKQFVRPALVTHAACNCTGNPHEIPLHPILILPTRTYNQFQKIADREGISVEVFINAVLEEGLKIIKKMGVQEVLALE